MTIPQEFDPGRYLITLRGKGGGQYLEVKNRILWLRTLHPDAMIETEMVVLTESWAVFKARVEIPGRGAACGHGSETQKGFQDFVEKSETAAIGRALAALGFGTQFCGDELAEGFHEDGRPNIVDSPTGGGFSFANVPPVTNTLPINDPNTPGSWLPEGGTHAQGDRTPGGATIKTIKFMGVLQRKAGVGDNDIHTYIGDKFSKAHRDDLSQQQASDVIEWLKALPVADDPAPRAPPQATPAQITNFQTSVADDPDVSWTGFWHWAREKGFTNRPGVESFVGRPILGADPVMLRAEMQQKLDVPFVEE